MDDSHLYQKIAETIRKDILEGRLKPGDRLPSVRQMTGRWGCTPGTVQRAYQELARQGLVISRSGQGTHVAGELPELPALDETPLRRAALVHRAEAFLLEAISAGHGLDEVEQAVQQAIDRWQAMSLTPRAAPASHDTLRFIGSHDPAVSLLSAHFDEICPGYRLDTGFTGSLGGLMALAEGRCDLAGSHLWDAESGEYNLPYVRRLLPGQRTALVTLAQRRLGLILPSGNPLEVRGLKDLTNPAVRFANRQPGSGTRVWLDATLHHYGMDTGTIEGYSTREKLTHSEVARAVASGEANAGLGLEAAARSYGLVFIFLTQERYELVIPAAKLQMTAVDRLVNFLNGSAVRVLLGSLSGYDLAQTGQIRWVEPL